MTSTTQTPTDRDRAFNEEVRAICRAILLERVRPLHPTAAAFAPPPRAVATS